MGDYASESKPLLGSKISMGLWEPYSGSRSCLFLWGFLWGFFGKGFRSSFSLICVSLRMGLSGPLDALLLDLKLGGSLGSLVFLRVINLNFLFPLVMWRLMVSSSWKVGKSLSLGSGPGLMTGLSGLGLMGSLKMGGDEGGGICCPPWLPP